MSRNVLVICNFPDIYFFTWKRSRKCKQIEKNNLVSLCSSKVEIEGTAEMLGNMTSEKNREILEIISEKQPGAVKRWENKPNMIIVRVKPLFACVDGYFDNDDAYLEYIDFQKQHAYKMKWGYY
jgi:general stress protein 26